MIELIDLPNLSQKQYFRQKAKCNLNQKQGFIEGNLSFADIFSEGSTFYEEYSLHFGHVTMVNVQYPNQGSLF